MIGKNRTLVSLSTNLPPLNGNRDNKVKAEIKQNVKTWPYKTRLLFSVFSRKPEL